MHPHMGIFRTYGRSDGLSMGPYESNTLTSQSAGTNEAHRDLLIGPVTWNPIQHITTYVYVYIYVYIPIGRHNRYEQQTLRRYVKIPPIVAYYPPQRAPSSASAVSHGSTVPTRFDSGFPDSIQIKFF